jgi:GAF domain-containing protein
MEAAVPPAPRSPLDPGGSLADRRLYRLRRLRAAITALSRVTTLEQLAAFLDEDLRQQFGADEVSFGVRAPDGGTPARIDPRLPATVGDDGARLEATVTDDDGRAVAVLGIRVAGSRPADFDQLGDDPDESADDLAAIADLVGMALCRVSGPDGDRTAPRPRTPDRDEDHAPHGRFRSELLHAVTARLSGHPSRSEIARAICEVTPMALGARTAVVLLPDPQGRPVLAAAGGHSPQTETSFRQLLDFGARVPATEALRTGRFIGVGDRQELLRRYPDAARLPLPFGAVAAVPCLHEGRPVASIAWGFEHERGFDQEFAELATEIGRHCGRALARGSLFDAEQRHAAQLAALQEVVTRMAGAADVAAVVDAATTIGPTAVEAHAAAVVVQNGGETLDVLTADGATRRRVAALLADPGCPIPAVIGGGPATTVREESLREAWVVVPFTGSAVIPGAVVLRYPDPPPAGGRAEALRTTLAEAVGQAVARVVAVDREHVVAVKLQQALLGRPDAPPGLQVQTLYRPSTIGMDVGGDWFDVIALPDGRIGLVIGDVAGHSLAAAAAMGQIRSTVRTLAPLLPNPARLLRTVETYLDDIENAEGTSMFYAVLDQDTGRLRYSCAGHPPPVLLPPDGRPEFLDGGLGPLLGVEPADRVDRGVAEADLPVGHTLVLFTDGLVERPDEDLSVGLRRLTWALTTAPPPRGTTAAMRAVSQHLLADHDGRDDVAILAVSRSG